MQKPNNKKQQKMLDVKPKLRPKKSCSAKSSRRSCPEKVKLKIASSAKRDFEQKIRRAWDVPTGSSGKTVSVRFTLSDSGSVSSIVITRSSGDDALMQVSKLQFRRLLPTQCHRILMQDEKREALPLLSEHNNFVRVTCFK